MVIVSKFPNEDELAEILSEGFEGLRQFDETLQNAIFEDCNPQAKNPNKPSPETLNGILQFLAACQSLVLNTVEARELNWCVRKASSYRALLMSYDVYVDVLRRPFSNLKTLEGGAKSEVTRGRGMFGIAAKDAYEKTVPVLVTRTSKHPKTKKAVKSSKRYLVHDEFNQASEGDHVYIVESRPVSKNKKFKLKDRLVSN